MKKVLVYFYSKNNLGDDLFVKIITDRYNNEFSSIVTVSNKSFDRTVNLKLY